MSEQCTYHDSFCDSDDETFCAADNGLSELSVLSETAIVDSVTNTDCQTFVTKQMVINCFDLKLHKLYICRERYVITRRLVLITLISKLQCIVK